MICEGWEGLTVDGRFPLLEWLGGWADRCVFLTVRQAAHTANIKLIQVGDEDADAYVAKWETAKTLPHPTFVEMMETGRYRLNDIDVAYVLTEKADTFLSGIVPQKALEPAAVREILLAVVDALAFVHEKGFVHGSVKPSSIVQIGEHWKLSADEMARSGEQLKLGRELDAYDAPELGTGAATAAVDMWSLGMIVVEACSQRTPVWDRNAPGDLGVPDLIPEPFREIARGCIRWNPAARISIEKVKELLDQMPVPAPTISEAVDHQPEAHVVATNGEVAAEPKVSTLTERVAAVRAADPDELRPAARPLFEPESDQLTPRSSRLFSDVGEEEHGSRMGSMLFVLLVLLVIGVVLGIRYKNRIMPLIAKQNAPAAAQQTPQTEAPQNPAGAVKPDQEPASAPAQTPPAASPTTESDKPAQAEPATQPATEAAKAPTPPAPETEASDDSSEAKSEPEPEKPAPKEPTPAPRVMNAKGAVLKRVLPNIAPGAAQSMRRPVQVDVRVQVSSTGAVSSAQCVTQSRGNYWARISQQAAESWKFKAPISEGHPQSSYWILLFQYNRGRTDVIAKELR